MIDIKMITLGYGLIKKKEILKDLSFKLKKSNITILYGPNGIGKTTILRCISGQITPSNGTIIWDGKDVTNNNYERRVNTSGIYESGKMLYQYASLNENRKIFKSLISTQKQKYIQSDDSLNLSSLINRPIDSLSLGQRQKCAIDLAFSKDAKLFFFDEPDNGLDRKSIDILANFLEKKKIGKTIVIATHDSLFANKIADSIIFISPKGCEQIEKKYLPKNINEFDNFLKTKLENRIY